MPNYRRRYERPYYFFTLVTYDRRPLFSNENARCWLRQAIERTRQERPWKMVAMVLMPDHLHMLWRLPENDSDYSGRIAALKKRFTRLYLEHEGSESRVTPAQRRHRRRGVWQERFWEHTIRDARDYRMHLDYIHINPVKHGLAQRPWDWPWSSFRGFVEKGVYETDWCGRTDLPGSVEYFWPE